jgi:hypothetical protein
MSAIEFLPLFAQFSHSSSVWLFATPLVWLFMGMGSICLVMSFFRVLGLAGYLFTLGVRIAAICLSAIIVQGLVFPIFFSTNSITSQTAIIEYGKILIFAAFLLIIFGWRLSALGLRAAFIKAFPFIVSLNGIFDFSAKYFWGKFLFACSWQVPGMDPPGSYRIFFTLILGIISGLPALNPLAKLSESGNIDEKTGWLTALIHTGVLKPEPLPLNRVWSPDNIPRGWTVFREKSDSDPYLLQLRPPETAFWSRITMSRLDVLIYQYPYEMLNEAAKFKQMTYANLKARKATIVEDRINVGNLLVPNLCTEEVQPKIALPIPRS